MALTRGACVQSARPSCTFRSEDVRSTAMYQVSVPPPFQHNTMRLAARTAALPAHTVLTHMHLPGVLGARGCLHCGARRASTCFSDLP